MDDITGKTSRGIVWSFIGQGINKGTTFVALMILARLLTKEDFGLVSAATIIVSFLYVYKDLGLGNALIQYRGDIEKAASSVFWINLILGIILTIVTFLIAPITAQYFGNYQITPVLRCLGLSFVINSFGIVHLILLRKELLYKKRIIAEIVGAFVKGLASIILALTGYGVWAIVIGQLIGASSTVIVAWLVLPWRPRLTISKDISSSLLKFGSSILGVNALSALTYNMVFVVVGKMCGIALLGVFTLSFRLPEILILGNLMVLAGVFFPVFSIIQDSPERLKIGFLASIRLVSLITTPICLGLFFIAEPVIYVFYGSQWSEAVPLLKIISLFAWIQSVGYHAGDVYKAIGRPNILLVLSIADFVVVLLSLLIGAKFGIIGIAFSLLVAGVISSMANIYISSRLVKVSAKEIITEYKSSIIAGILFTIVALVFDKLSSAYPNQVRLLAMAVPACLIYAGTVWISEKENICFVAEKLGFTINKKRN